MKKPVVVGDKPNAPPPPPKEDAVLGTLKGHELLNFREASVAERRAQRELQKAQLRSQEVIDGIRERHRDIRWKKVTGIDDDTGEIKGKA